MAKEPSEIARINGMRSSSVNIGEPWPDLDEAELRVHQMQTKLHQWATADPGRRFDDLFNLVYGPGLPRRGVEPGQGEQGCPDRRSRRGKPRSIVFGEEYWGRPAR